jgi:hypothetical protein
LSSNIKLGYTEQYSYVEVINFNDILSEVFNHPSENFEILQVTRAIGIKGIIDPEATSRKQESRAS